MNHPKYPTHSESRRTLSLFVFILVALLALAALLLLGQGNDATRPSLLRRIGQLPAVQPGRVCAVDMALRPEHLPRTRLEIS